ncbi:MAG: type II toxin-antitoxin system Phd/YefM family antitoxin [Clostridiales Family XIII bacterium]|jgi:prevent-host-death family protein|nr:type II toxin-antitoxin system Phd/YefM family antitoxin [Clostridiales Family XIII bacterium]
MVNIVPKIRPVSDLKNSFGEISALVKEDSTPVFLTKNGHGEMVLMSMETYSGLIGRLEIELKLTEAEIEAERTDVRYSHDEVMSRMRKRLQGVSNV